MVEAVPTCATLDSVVFASVNLPTKVRSQASRSPLGNSEYMDPISNMIVSIKNAGDAGRDTIVIPYSKLKHDIAKILVEEKYVRSASKKGSEKKPTLEVELYMDKRTPKVKGVKRLSKPSKRVYRKVGDIRPVKQGYGILVLSTPAGIMAGYKAKKAGVGGEALFNNWEFDDLTINKKLCHASANKLSPSQRRQR